jgi:Family of unknown function (DUF6416)
MTDGSSELVSILVPKEHLGKIYGFIGTLDGGGGETSAPLTPTSDKETTWTPELIRRQYNESPEMIKQFQKLLAQHAGEWLSTKEIAQRLNARNGSKTIAGALGAYGRRTSNRYKMKGWPFQNQWLHAEGQQSYSMTPEVAEIIKPL